MSTVCSCTDIDNLYSSYSANNQVAHFLIHIGQKSLCNISYHSGGSTGNADGVVRTLKSYNYKKVTKHLGFGAINQSKASAMLRSGKPVYLDGSDHKRGAGHAWVIDGEWEGYFHCNWGWNGVWDGYYAKHNYFPVYSRGYIDSTDPGTTAQSVYFNDYDWNFRMITYNL